MGHKIDYFENQNHFSREKMSLKVSYFKDVDGRLHYVLARRGRDDCPQGDDSQKKVKVLTKRRIIRVNLASRLWNPN